MATALKKNPCAKCPKGVGVTTCDGCQQSFCIKHIIEHRQELAIKMDNIGQEHDSLRRDLSEKNRPHPLLLRIDEWEKESILKIQSTAKTARTNLRQLLDETKNDLKISVDEITNELQTHRGLDDYTELDLTRWSTKLIDARKLLETPSTIQIVEDENISNVIHLIKVIETKQLHVFSNTRQLCEKIPLRPQQSYGSTQEIFNETVDGISLSEGGLVATYTDMLYSYPTVFAKNLYRSGVHHIHFRVESKDQDNFFFGIVTSSQDIVPKIFKRTSANVWWGFDIAVLDGEPQQYHGEDILKTSDVVKLTLDCDNQQILFENYRAKKTLQSRINIKKCPFPWKIAISLSRQNDMLRII